MSTEHGVNIAGPPYVYIVKPVRFARGTYGAFWVEGWGVNPVPVMVCRSEDELHRAMGEVFECVPLRGQGVTA